MTTRKLLTFFLLLFLFSPRLSLAQFDSLRFERLNKEFGAPNGLIFQAAEDQYGFLWFATEEGLFRYDGYEFKAYRHNVLDSTTLSHPLVRCVYEDRQGNIWAGTTYGLNLLDRRTGTFRRFLPNPEDRKKSKVTNIVQQVFEDRAGNLWVVASGRLYSFDRQLRQFTSPSLADLQESSHFIEDLFETAGGQLWAATRNGLFLLEPARGSSRHFLPSAAPESLYNKNITKLEEDGAGNLWLATEGGLAKWDPGTGDLSAVPFPEGYRQMPVQHLTKDHHGNLWMTLRGNGIALYDLRRRRFRFFTYQAEQYNSLNSDDIQFLLPDQFHNIWACTVNGLCKIRVEESGFTLLQNEGGFDNLSNHILRVMQTRQGAIWSSTPGGVFQLESGRLRNYLAAFPVTAGEVVADWMVEDADGGIWVGHRHGGLYRRLPAGDDFRKVPLGDSLDQGLIYKIVNDAADPEIMWLGTSFGLCRLNRRSLQRSWYIPSQDIPGLTSDRVIIFDQFGTDEIWLYYTYFNSLGRFDKATGKFEIYRPGPENRSVLDGDIKDIAIGSDGNIWLATLFGLANFNIPTKAFRLFTKGDGLLENELNTVVLDGEDRVWIGGNQFLGLFDHHTGTFRNYLLAKEVKNFLTKSRFLAGDGRIFMGSSNGIYTFHPGEVRENRQEPLVVLTDFKVKDASYSLPQPFEETTHILLGHDENDITFEFSAIHLLNPQANEYRCQLEGFNDQWRSLGREHKVSYTNLGPGDYVFRVAAANSDGFWNEEGLKITLAIAPAFWQTFWFKTLILLVLVSIAYAVYKNRQHQVSLRREKEMAEQSAAYKTRFLANVSHEIRTPMNAIIGLSGLLEETSLDDRQQKFVGAIHQSSKSLLVIINDLLDHTRLEAGQFSFVALPFRLDMLTGQLHDLFVNLAAEKRLELHISTGPEVPEGLVGDQVRLSQILTNLLGNAVKFTDSGKVWLHIRTLEEEDRRVLIHFEVGDTGPGIPEEKMDSIFEDFTQVEAGHSTRGSGLGLAIARQLVQRQGGQLKVESQPGKGTVLWFSLWFEKGAGEEKASPAADGGYAFDVLRVLVVEDTPFNQMLAVELLKKHIRTPHIDVADHGRAALQMLDRETYDLILMDVKMPIMDGYETARCIRSREPARQGRIPILGVTAGAGPEELEKCREAGMDDCVVKPVEGGELVAKIRRLVAPAGIPDKTLNNHRS